MRVLLTGASGFVGSAICQKLCEDGHDVTILMRKSSSPQNLAKAKFQTVLGDLRDSDSLVDAVQNQEVVIHVAGIISAPYEGDYFKANTLGTENLVAACRKVNKDLKRFVYVSSLAAGGPASKDKPKTEAEDPSPISIYGQSKLGGESILQALGESFPSVVIRPPAVYGPRDRGMFSFFQIVNSGILPMLGARRACGFSLVHVEDLVEGILAASFSDKEFAAAEIFYICGDNVYSWLEVMQAMKVALDKKTITVNVPIFILKFAGSLLGFVGKLSGKTMPINADKVKELKVDYWTCSNQKAKEKLGFVPKWELQAGISQTAKWYRENAWL